MPKRKRPTSMYFASLDIENVRCFGVGQHLDLTSQDGRPARWTLMLGDNGVGKTTLLQCLSWMRLVPESGFEIGQPDKDDSGEPPPLARGKLGPALSEGYNEILESLLRVNSGVDLTLDATLSFSGRLSSTDTNEKGVEGRGKAIRAGVQLSFDSKGRLLKYEPQGRWPRVETTLGGEFHEPLVVTYGANRQLGKQNLDDLDDPTIATRLSERTELYDIELILSSLDYAATKNPKSSERVSQKPAPKAA